MGSIVKDIYETPVKVGDRIEVSYRGCREEGTYNGIVNDEIRIFTGNKFVNYPINIKIRILDAVDQTPQQAVKKIEAHLRKVFLK